jgi:hypothetical protein
MTTQSGSNKHVRAVNLWERTKSVCKTVLQEVVGERETAERVGCWEDRGTGGRLPEEPHSG